MTRYSQYRIAFGVVLVAAFVSAAGMLLQAEPPQAVGTWASIGATPESRVGGAAVALADGRTLIAGGSIQGTPTDTVVIFNPADGSFASAGQLLAPRVGHTATLLDDGRVLIVGGTVAGLLRNDLELFDPSSGTSVPSVTMPQPRSGHAAARLADGTVLIAGGTTADGVVLQTAEIYDPSADTTTPTTLPMLMPRTGASATTLIDGRVLIAGGSSNGSADLSSAEIYQPWSQLFEAVDTGMSVARSGHAAVLLPWNNSVLIAGGSSDGVAQLTSDLFLPAEFPDPYSYGIGHFGSTGSMAAPRVSAVATPHIEGYAVAMGGGAADAEVYRFATIKTDKDDYAPGENAIITGSGWEPNSEVTLLFQEDPAVHDDYVIPDVPTDGEGNFTWNTWAPEHHDIGVRFYVLARDSRSRAQITFTDSPKVGSVVVNGAQAPSPVTAGGTAQYANVVVSRGSDNGSSGNVAIAVSLQGSIPAGVSISSTSPASISMPSAASSTTFTLNVATTSSTPAGTHTLTLRASTSANDFADTTFGLNVQSACTAPTITTHPTTQTVTYGIASVAFAAAASGTPTPTVQWQVSVGGGPFNDIGGATSTTHTINNPGVILNGNQYRAVFTNTCGGTPTATTNAATLTVNRATAVVVVTPYDVPYDGVQHTAAVVSVTGVNGETGATVGNVDVSNTAHTNAGTYASDSWSFTGTANYNNIASTPITDEIDKVTPTATLAVTNSPLTYTGSGLAATVAISASSVPGAVANILTGGAATQTTAGTYAVTADFVPADTTNYNSLIGLAAGNFVIDKATPTATLAVNNSPQTYTGSGLAATVAISASSVPGAVANILTGGAATQTTAATYAVTADFVPADTTNYNSLIGLAAGDFVIDKATPTATLAVNNSPQTYTGSGLAATVAISASSVPGAVANILTGGAATQTTAATYAVTADFVPADTTNYNSLIGLSAGNFVIDKATPTATLAVNNSPQTYTGSGLAATVGITVSSVPGTVANILTGGAATQTTAATYAVTADFVPTDTANYNSLIGLSAGNFVIDKATPTATLAVNNSPQTYTGSGLAATVGITVSSVPGAVANILTGGAADQTTAATYAVTADFVPSDTANYNSLIGLSAGNFVIDKATPTATLAVNNSPQTYTGSGLAATVAITVSSVPGALANILTGGAATQTPAGTYGVTADFVPTDTANYNSLIGLPAGNLVIDKASSTTTTVGDGPFTYNGTTQTGGSGTVTGAGSLSTSATSLTYTGDQVNAGTYYVTAHYAGDANHDPSDGAAEGIVIQKASSTTTTVGDGPFTYDGTTHTGGSGTVTGAGSLSTSATSLTYTGDQVNAGTYYATAHYAGDANHDPSDGAAVGIVIQKANATVVVAPYNVTYDTFAHTATVTSITGVNSETGATVGTVTLNTTHTAAGTYNTDSWSFAGTANYNNIASTTITDTIGKANAVVVVSPYNVQWDGNPHTATHTITGVNGETGSTVGTVTLNTTHTAIGTYDADSWSFTPTANYNTVAGATITDVISTAYCFNGFLSPIGGSVETSNGGSFLNPVRAFKLGSTIPVKFLLNSWNGSTCGAVVTTGIHTLQATYYSSAVDSDQAIDASPTDAATTGNQFRLTSPEWHFNLSTKGGGFKAGTWLLKATLQDGSVHTVWITIKK